MRCICLKIQLCVKISMAECIGRRRGALMGNCVGPWFGKTYCEERIHCRKAVTDPWCIKFLGVLIRPTAWCCDILVFANSIKNVAELLSVMAHQLEPRHLQANDESFELVLAAARRLLRPCIKQGPSFFDLTDENKLLR